MIIVSDHDLTNEFIARLDPVFKCKDLGELKFFLGIHIDRNFAEQSITIHQNLYAEKVLTRFRMDKSNPNATPASGELLVPYVATDPPTEFPKRFAFKEVLGSLMYLMCCTRPDIAYALIAVSAFTSNPGPKHYAALKHILRYLRGTTNLGITFDGKNYDSPTLCVSGFTDSNYGNIHDGRSTAGHVTVIAGAAISWRSTKLKTVATSTTEAEFQAQKFAIHELIFMRHLLDSLGHTQLAPTKLFADNQAAIAVALGEGIKPRCKHYMQHVHYVRDTIQNKEIDLRYIKSADNAADIFTKPVTCAQTFQKLCALIGVHHKQHTTT